MTLNDLQFMNGHFTLNFHYYKPRFQQLDYILIVEHIYRMFLSYDATSRDVRKRTAEYCGSAKGLRVFRREKVPGATSSEP